MADLAGQPYLPSDRESAYAKQVMTQTERGLSEATLDDVPDMRRDRWTSRRGGFPRLLRYGAVRVTHRRVRKSTRH